MNTTTFDNDYYCEPDKFVPYTGNSDQTPTEKPLHTEDPVSSVLPQKNPLYEFKSCKNSKDPYIFISYAHSDAERVRPFFEILESNNFRYWYDQGLPSGEDFSSQIARHIKCAVQFIIFLSENAQNSNYVRNELHIATKYNKNILVVYLEQFELEDGLELTIDRIQSLCAYKFTKNDLEKKFYEELSKDTLKKLDIDDCNSETAPTVKVSNDIAEKYKNFKLLTKTRMNEIYSATSVSTGMKVIIKKTVFSDNQNKEYFLKCYRNERKVLESVQCPFLPKLIDIYEYPDSNYIVETFIYGEQLSEKHSYNEEFVIKLGLKIAHILKYFYYNGAVHCDIKPSNIIVNELGDIFLIDFGASVFISERSEDDVHSGTFGYAAPEQLTKGGIVDFRTDIYGLGRTMLSLLVSDKLSSEKIISQNGSTILDDMTCALNIPSVKPQYINRGLEYYDSNANPELARIINKMISAQKENRYFSIDTLISDLEKCRCRCL